jgi:hypothetical protein
LNFPDNLANRAVNKRMWRACGLISDVAAAVGAVASSTW